MDLYEENHDTSIDEADIGISLPNVEEIKTDVHSQPMVKKWKLFGAAAVIVLVFIVGLSAGLAGKGGSSPSALSSTASNQGDSAGIVPDSPQNVAPPTAPPQRSPPPTAAPPTAPPQIPPTHRPTPKNDISDPESPEVAVLVDAAIRYNKAFALIEEIQLSNRVEMQTNGTAQNRALNWITTYDQRSVEVPTNLSTEGAHKFIQRFILAVLYFNNNGPQWEHQCSFLSTKDQCDWNRGISTQSDRFKYGISCDSSGKITEIFMPGNNLEGNLPFELGDLTELSHISLYSNRINGTFPLVLNFLPKLEFIAMESNHLEGSIPSWIGNLRNLKTLALGDNLLTGKLPSTISKLTALTEVALDGNVLSGEVGVFAKLPELTRLYLGQNEFSDAINDSFLTGMKLKELDLSSNGFIGEVPVHFFNEHTLHILDLHGNELAGDIPAEITSNTKLHYFSAYDNSLDFAIPTTISNLKHLKHLDLSSNKFSGVIPSTLNLMTRLEYLFLARNRFEEQEIPDLQDLVSLQELSLKAAQITGTIPTEIGLLTSLVLLDLGDNQISGRLPRAMETLTNLRFLILNHNLLTGTITVGFKKLTSIEMILLDDNQITGGAFHVCGPDGPENPAIMSSDCCDGDSCESTMLPCICCTLCCADKTDCYNDEDLLAQNDLEWQHTFTLATGYERDSYVFSEDMVFAMKRGAE